MSAQSPPSAPEETLADSEEILTDLLASNPTASVLVIAPIIPEPIYHHRGVVVTIGRNSGGRAFKSSDIRCLEADNTSAVARAIETISYQRPGLTFDIVIIDHDHRLSSILAHIKAAQTVSSLETLFLFDDAVPPTIEMAGPQPTQGWWVGEVWMLPHLLRRADTGFLTLTCECRPTGLLAAAGFTLPDADEIASLYVDLSRVATDTELAALSNHSSAAEFLWHCNRALRDRQMLSFVALSLGLPNDPAMTSRMIDQSQEWQKPKPQFFLDLSGREIDVSRVYDRNQQMHGKAVDTFKQGYLVGSDGLIVDGKYFDHKADLHGHDRLQRRAEGYGTYDNFGTGIRLLDDKIVLPKENLRRAKLIDEAVMLGTPDELDNWGMWVFLGIPSLWEFLRNRQDYSKFMAYVRHPWQRTLLLTLGLDACELIEHDHEDCYRIQQLSMVRHSHRDLAVTPDDKAIFGEITQRFSDTDHAAAGERIFISRLFRTRKLQVQRGLTNEEELIESLSELGFTCIEPEFFDFPQQVAIFNAARVVVGLGGSGMFNTVFCRPGTKVVTIESGTVFVKSHTNIFATMDLDYGIIIGREDLTDLRTPHPRWTLDVKAAVRQIADF